MEKKLIDILMEMEMWIARDRNNELNMFVVCPERDGEEWCVPYGCTYSMCAHMLDPVLFPELKWIDEPLHVSLNKLSDIDSIWDERILFHLNKAFEIAENYSNPLRNDGGGSMECSEICRTISPLIERLKAEVNGRNGMKMEIPMHLSLPFDEAVQSLISILNSPIGRRKNTNEINKALDAYLSLGEDVPERERSFRLKSLISELKFAVYAESGNLCGWNDLIDIKTCMFVIYNEFDKNASQHPYKRILDILEEDLNK